MRIEKSDKRLSMYLESVGEFGRFAVERSTDWSFVDLSSRRVGREDFYGSDSFDECVERTASGWAEGYKKIHDKLVQFRSEAVRQEYKPVAELDIAGFLPDVPEYLAGSPAHMWTTEEVEDRRVVSIYVSRNASAFVTPAQIEHYGVALMAVVERLETEGTDVELHACHLDKHGEYSVWTDVRIKAAGEYMSEDSLAFVFAHPGFLRRLQFSAVEHSPNKWGFQSGYGSPTDPGRGDSLIPPGSVYFPQISKIASSMGSVETALDKVNSMLKEGLANPW